MFKNVPFPNFDNLSFYSCGVRELNLEKIFRKSYYFLNPVIYRGWSYGQEAETIYWNPLPNLFPWYNHISLWETWVESKDIFSKYSLEQFLEQNMYLCAPGERPAGQTFMKTRHRSMSRSFQYMATDPMNGRWSQRFLEIRTVPFFEPSNQSLFTARKGGDPTFSIRGLAPFR